MAQSDPATRLGQKFAWELESREVLEAQGKPVPTEESAIRNLVQLIHALGENPNEESLIPDGVVKKSTKSGQFRFHKSDKFQTKFSDGSVRTGLHGIGFYATEHSEFKGPKCANCGRIHDLQKCSRCKKAWYCDKDCQTIDWPAHKGHCIAPN